MDHRAELLKVFDIGPEDLEANRVGALGQRQARRLLRSGHWNLVGAVFIGLALAAILYWVARKPLAPVQWILAAGLFVAAMITGIVYFRRVRAAVAEGRVQCLTGPVQTRMQRRAGWYLSVAGRSFRLPVRFWHVRNGRSYRVYVSPQPNVIVAMEPDGWE